MLYTVIAPSEVYIYIYSLEGSSFGKAVVSEILAETRSAVTFTREHFAMDSTEEKLALEIQ